MKRYISLLITVIMVTILTACDSLVEKGEQARKDEEYLSAQQSAASANSESSTAINLSETYTNEAEGISFKYPSGWKIIEGDSLNEYYNDSEIRDVVAFLANEQGDPEGYSYIEVYKFSTDKNEKNKIFSATESDFEMTIDGEDVMVAVMSDVTLSGVPARMLIYTADGVYVRRFYYAIDDVMYKIDFICQTRQAEALEPFFIAISESYNITKDDTASTAPNSEISSSAFMVVTAEPSLRMRSGEGTEYDIITEIPYGETVEVLNDRDPEWIEVRYGEYFGYVLGKYLVPGVILADSSSQGGVSGGQAITAGEAEQMMNDIIPLDWRITYLGEKDNKYEFRAETSGKYDMVYVDKYTSEITTVYGNIDIQSMIERKKNADAAFEALPSLGSDFEWTTQPFMLNGVVEGTIRNTTNKTYSYVQITFTLYDMSKNQIGTAFANINNLAGGNTWKFKATSFENDAWYFEFAEITAW